MGGRRSRPCRGALCVPDAGAECKGSRPCSGNVERSPRGSGLRRESPLRGREEGGKGSRPCNAPCVACPKPRLLGDDLCLLKSVLPPAGKAGYREIRPCRGRGCAFHTGAECKGSRPCNAHCGACPKPRLLGDDLCLLKSVLPPAGKEGAAWGCRPTEHPLPTPAGNPARLSGRPLLAWFGRLLGRADTHHSCSQRPLRRNDLRATPRAPQGSAKRDEFGR